MIKSKHRICIKCNKVKSWSKTPSNCRECYDKILRIKAKEFYTLCPGCNKKCYFKYTSGVSRAKKLGARNCQSCKVYKPIVEAHGITIKEIIQQIPPFELYSTKVRTLTRQQPLELLENYDKRGSRNYHLDHKVSLWKGFLNNIPPEKIAHIDNLQMLWWIDNLKKGPR